MRCDDVLVNLPDYVLKKTEPNLSRGIESHLVYCETCKKEKEKLSSLTSVLLDTMSENYSPSFWNELHVSIMSKISKPRRSLLGMRVPQFVSIAVLLVIVIGIGTYELTVRPRTRQPQSISLLATSLPPEEVIALPTFNINYVQTAAPTYGVDEEVNSVDDAMQEDLVKSMWAAVADTVSASEYPDLVDGDLLN